MLEGLEIVPPAAVASPGAAAGDMDLGAVLARRPQVALVDELAHGNPHANTPKRHCPVRSASGPWRRCASSPCSGWPLR
jgi:K+-sensing histidine kinase KdpD